MQKSTSPNVDFDSPPRHTPAVGPGAYRCKFWEKVDWIVLNRPHIPNITELSLLSGLAKGAVGGSIKLAEARGPGNEPNFTRDTLMKMAGAARVSFSWISGMSDNPDGPDIPPAPIVDPALLARRRLGKAADAEDIEARVSALEKQMADLQKQLKK